MADYVLTANDAVIRRQDGARIPDDQSNRDWVAFQDWLAARGVPDPYVPPPEPVPAEISDRQFFQQLAVAGLITEEQALAANAAVIPSPLLAIIGQMPSGDQFAAKMLVSGATVFQRNHPMTEAIGAAQGWTAAQIDDFFRAAALL